MKPGFYNMDCMEGMRQFPDGFFDLAIVDPPYGINVAANAKGAVICGKARPFGGRGNTDAAHKKSNGAPVESKSYHTFTDDRIPDDSYFKELARVSKNRIIWGGNYMLDHLGAASCLIVWDKKRRGLTMADCEIAWTNLPGQSRIFEYKWNGMLRENMKDKEERIHPTQKPVMLYSWLLSKYAKPGMKILDTHVGSASSLIACHRAGLDYWGFEIDTTYYKMAKERLDKEAAQVNLSDLLQVKIADMITETTERRENE